MRLNEIVPGYVMTIEEFLTGPECATLLDEVAQRPSTAGAELPLSFVGVDAAPHAPSTAPTLDHLRPQLAHQLWESLRRLLPRDGFGGWRPVGVSPRFHVYRYDPGRRYAPQTDVPSIQGEALSQLTLRIDLNDDFRGGSTRFRKLRVHPRQGSALLYRHELEHEVGRVLFGTRFVLRTDVLYRRLADGRLDSAPGRLAPARGVMTTGRHA